MTSKITKTRKVGFTKDGVHYVVLVTSWDGGKPDSVEMFQIMVGAGNKLIAHPAKECSPLHSIKFPSRASRIKK